MAGLFAAAVVIGAGAAVYYALADLTLSHYDARAHLVVARRIVDSLTPGWQQIGAVWLPLPHLVNMPVVQWDWAYRTGFVSTGLCVLVLSAGLAALGGTLFRWTRSWPAALAAPAVILLNPNVLYLQSTPMTEPLLLGLSLLALRAVSNWCAADEHASAVPAGLLLAALTLTRYEGWLVAGALVVLAACGKRRLGLAVALRPGWYVAAAVGCFLLLSKGATGVWFVSSGFFEPEPLSLHQIGPTFDRVWYGTRELGGLAVVCAGLAGAALALRDLARGRVTGALPLVLLAAALLPLYAFYSGHPFRIRYMVPVVVALGALSGLVVGAIPRRAQVAAALALVLVIGWEKPPFDSRAAMVLEAQWEAPFRLGRRGVTQYLSKEWDGTPILASMGSLAHYMQESSHAGFGIAHFVHEGNGDLWQAARRAPSLYVNWVLIEERAEGGDELAVRARGDASYLSGLTRVAEGGGVALYRRR
jgi:hypothetical protein